jgi:hypothetical protein
VEHIIAGFYLGLFIFALNGLQLIALQQKSRELAAKEDDIRRLLMRLKLRNK